MTNPNNEAPRIHTWLAGRLLGDATLVALLGSTLNVFREAIPDALPDGSKPVPPWVRIQRIGAEGDLVALGNYRVWTRGTYQVFGETRSESITSLQAIADRLEVLLMGATGSTSGLGIITVERIAPWEYAYDDPSEQRWQQLGGEWTITAQPV